MRYQNQKILYTFRHRLSCTERCEPEIGVSSLNILSNLDLSGIRHLKLLTGEALARLQNTSCRHIQKQRIEQ